MPVFDPESFFEYGGGPEPVPVELGGYVFFIRPLDGIETEEYALLGTQAERAVWLLAHGLTGAGGRAPVAPETARRLMARHYPLALELAARIIRLTESVWDRETARWRETEMDAAEERSAESGPAEDYPSPERFFNDLKRMAEPRQRDR